MKNYSNRFPIYTFSKEVDVDALLLYARAVMESSNAFLPKLSYDDIKQKFTDVDKDKLVDYWCSKDVRGLLKMPFCRHWIMYIEAMFRIKNQLCKMARKGIPKGI